jgi:hypothetical protein
MNISAQIRILAGIRTGSVYYFIEEKLSSEKPHYFIVLNRSPRIKNILVLVCASSQTKKRQEIAKKLGFSDDTLVLISPSEYSLFSKNTVVDCNSVFEKTAQSLIDKLEACKLGVCTEIMPAEIVEKLIRGVKASTQVSEEVKEILK